MASPQQTWIAVESSMITHAGYSETTMFLRFKSGKEYAYPNMPKKIYDDMMVAESIGKYFSQHIKGKFRDLPIHN